YVTGSTNHDLVANDDDAVTAEPRMDAHDLFRNRNEASAVRQYRADANINVDVRYAWDIAAADDHVAAARALLLIELDSPALTSAGRGRAVPSIIGTLEPAVRLTSRSFTTVRLARGGTLEPVTTALLARTRAGTLSHAKSVRGAQHALSEYLAMGLFRAQ